MKRLTAVRLVLACALLNILLYNAGWQRNHSHQLKVTFLDVGQGDAAVIETPEGHTALIDCGGLDPETHDVNEGERVVAPYLRLEGINRIDAILLSHPHADHIGGAAVLLERFPTRLLIDNGQQTNAPEQLRYESEAKSADTEIEAGSAGGELDFGDGVRFEILGPTEAERHGRPNNASLVVKVQYGRRSFLFLGDAEREQETQLVEERAPVACDVLKVAHHGSDTSSTERMLALAHPHWAIVSVGAHNHYGHPGPEAINRLKSDGIAIERTDRLGAIQFVTDGYGMEMTTYRQ